MANITETTSGTATTESGNENYSVTGTVDSNTGEVRFTILLNDKLTLFNDKSYSETNYLLGRLVSQPGRKDTALWTQVQQTVVNQNSSLTAQYQQLVPPSPTEPIPPTTENTPDPNNLSGPSNEDSGGNPNSAVTQAAQTNNPQLNTKNSTNITNNNFAGANPASSTAAGITNNVVQSNVSADPKPGIRLKNPLGNFASYTYQLSLYMITPDAYSAFVNGGRKNVNQWLVSNANGANVSGGAYLVLQSGGVNTALNSRPPDMKYDYYIDNLVMRSAINTKTTASETNVTGLSFNIIEPYGFSLINDLKRAHEKLKSVCKIKNYNKTIDPIRQFFILGIRFQGYDKDGQLANASTSFSDDTYNNSPDSSGVYERFYDIVIESFKFKLAGGATTYNINAKVLPKFIALNYVRGAIKENITVVANTVENAIGPGVTGNGLVSLFDAINQNEKKKEKNKERSRADEFAVRWVGDSDVIKSSPLRSPANKEKSQSAGAPINNESQVTENIATKVVYDDSKKTMTFGGQTILQAISKIMRLSQYLESSLRTIYKSTSQPNPKTKSPEQTPPEPNPPKLQWFNVSTDVEVLEYDEKINDYAYKITYVIQPYETPAAYAGYGEQVKYYGPHKRYDYWFTGQNSEIINFELQYDNAFFNVNFGGDQSGSTSPGQIPSYSGMKSGQDATGGQYRNQEAQNSYMTSLFDPKAYGEAKITILGDPDFLIRDTPGSPNEEYRQFYSNDFTINPNGGHVFVEINFNEGVDYNTSTGTMTINESIKFWDYPNSVKDKVKGIAFMVTEVESIFKGGKFTQNLKLILNPYIQSEDKNETLDASGRQNAFNDPRSLLNNTRSGTQSSNSTPGTNKTSSSPGTGLTEYTDPMGTSDASAIANAGGTAPPYQPGPPLSDDDAASMFSNVFQSGA